MGRAFAMICATCKHENWKKNGKDQYGQQKCRCLLCGKSWILSPPKPFGRMNVPKDKAIFCVKLLLEGNSVRATSRLTGLSKSTIIGLLVLIGERAKDYWNRAMRNLPADNVQADECWGYVYAKEKTCVRKHIGPCCGDAYTFLAIERDTKLILTWHLGRRDQSDTMLFSDKLRTATAGRFQLTTDGFQPYARTVPEAFSGNIDFAQLVKQYGAIKDRKAEARYSPAEIIGIRKTAVWGDPDMEKVCTSHVERQNLNIRMGIRRMTRLTNAFSKKWENHEAHLAIYFLYYNFCRVHQTLKTTPAVAAGLTDKTWSLETLLMELAVKS
jgi:IS1 family transposase/transposase-like protein